MTDTGNGKIRKYARIKASVSREQIVHKNVLNIFAIVVFSTMQSDYINHPVKKNYFL